MAKIKGNSAKKPTQGQTKILRLIDDLIRNKPFLVLLKQVISIQDKRTKQFQTGNYYTWTPEEKKEHDYINKELGKIVGEYEKLKKRTDKIIHNKDYKIRQKIAWEYGLDDWLINLAILRYKEDKSGFDNLSATDGDMCFTNSDLEDQMYTFNKGMDWIKLNPKKQLSLFAYPFSISVHRNASKRDVLDYIEKNWSQIERMKFENDEKSYRARKRKYDQKMLDFMWQNRSMTAKQLQLILNNKFPKNGLAYYEISKLIQLEKRKRLDEFEI